MDRPDLPDVSRLHDGRLLWMRGLKRPLVRVNGSWVRCTDVTVGQALDSKPLDKYEIAGLVDAGIFEIEDV